MRKNTRALGVAVEACGQRRAVDELMAGQPRSPCRAGRHEGGPARSSGSPEPSTTDDASPSRQWSCPGLVGTLFGRWLDFFEEQLCDVDGTSVGDDCGLALDPALLTGPNRFLASQKPRNRDNSADMLFSAYAVDGSPSRQHSVSNQRILVLSRLIRIGTRVI